LADVWLAINPGAAAQVSDPASIAAGALAHVDVSGNQAADAVRLSVADVQVFGQKDLVVNDQTGTGNLQMIIRGDAVDRVELAGGADQWVDRGTTVFEGETYQILQHDNLQLLVGVNMQHDPTAM
jgi:hypothetical protein